MVCSSEGERRTSESKSRLHATRPLAMSMAFSFGLRLKPPPMPFPGSTPPRNPWSSPCAFGTVTSRRSEDDGSVTACMPLPLRVFDSQRLAPDRRSMATTRDSLSPKSPPPSRLTSSSPAPGTASRSSECTVHPSSRQIVRPDAVSSTRTPFTPATAMVSPSRSSENRTSDGSSALQVLSAGVGDPIDGAAPTKSATTSATVARMLNFLISGV